MLLPRLAPASRLRDAELATDRSGGCPQEPRDGVEAESAGCDVSDADRNVSIGGKHLATAHLLPAHRDDKRERHARRLQHPEDPRSGVPAALAIRPRAANILQTFRGPPQTNCNSGAREAPQTTTKQRTRNPQCFRALSPVFTDLRAT